MISISSYGGVIGWWFKKQFPNLASEAFLRITYLNRRKKTREYIEWFMNEDKTPQPLIIAIETINRCNNVCAFCPANVKDEKRAFAQMSDEDFKKIIKELQEWNYKGMVSLFINNEPFMDTRIIEWHRYVRQELPDCKIKLFTNGLLMTLDKFLTIKPYVDYLTINNYSEKRKLLPNVQKIYDYVCTHEEDFRDIEIKIQIRYIQDVLTNRNGTSPNKKQTQKLIQEPCLFPYTDMMIYPNGNAGICCNDALEKTNLGNIKEEPIWEIWEKQHSEMSYGKVRKAIRKNRTGYGFCRHCDFVDTGLRIKVSSKTLKDKR